VHSDESAPPASFVTRIMRDKQKHAA
jgi:hypothetical protein